MNIEELYLNDSFNNLLVMIANQRRITNFDDYKQDVFLEIIDCDYLNMKQFKRAARRVAQRYIDNRTVDVESLSAIDENGDIETHDETMARLVYHGKGRYV